MQPLPSVLWKINLFEWMLCSGGDSVLAAATAAPAAAAVALIAMLS